MKKFGAILLVVLLSMSFAMGFSAQTTVYADYYDAYDADYEDYYGDKDDYEAGYLDGKKAAQKVIYRTREVSAKEYIADHPTRFRELWITLLLTLGICVVPILLIKYGFKIKPMQKQNAAILSVIYNTCALLLITYILYRIDYLMPCTSVVILWAIICKKILESGKQPSKPVEPHNPLYSAHIQSKS